MDRVQKQPPGTHSVHWVVAKCQSNDTFIFLFVCGETQHCNVCVKSLKSSFRRAPDRQSQSRTDVPRRCSDVSVFQSSAAKGISPALDFLVAHNGL